MFDPPEKIELPKSPPGELVAMSSGAQPSVHYLALDAMRGIAAINVLFLHAAHLFTGYPLDTLGLSLSVDFFFVLSGFVVCHAYEGKLRGGMTWRSYAWKRIVRLYPLAILGTTLGLATAPSASIEAGGLFGNYIFNVLVLPSPVSHGNGAFPINPPLWSLFIELLLSAAFIIFAWLPTRVLAVIALASLGTFAAAYMAKNAYPVVGKDIVLIAGVLARGTGPFLCGMIMRRTVTNVPGQAFPVLAIATIIVLVAPVKVSLWLALPMIYLLFPLTVKSGAAARSFPAGKLLGDVSYALYITHYPLLLLLQATGVSGMAWCVGAMLACLVIAWSVGRFVDLPVRRWLTQLGRPPRHSAAT